MIRQGDVLLVPVQSLPEGCTEIPTANRIVLAYGEVTGHAHAIYDYKAASKEIAQALFARLLHAPNGERYLEVKQPVTLRHEEHSPHTIPPGIYKLPTQVEYTPAELRRVED